MEHTNSLSFTHEPQPGAVVGWAKARPESARNLRTKIQYQKTRSTIALNADDLSDQAPEQSVETFKYLMKISKFFARNEIVVDCLETLAGSNDDQAIRRCFDAVQSDIIAASRLLDMELPRVALEKRRDHFDVRIYPTHH